MDGVEHSKSVDWCISYREGIWVACFVAFRLFDVVYRTASIAFAVSKRLEIVGFPIRRALRMASAKLVKTLLSSKTTLGSGS